MLLKQYTQFAAIITQKHDVEILYLKSHLYLNGYLNSTECFYCGQWHEEQNTEEYDKR